ncbi:beta-propeller fold lactonase family protein [uncultured Reyranella sp.]|uniref:YncE family protein n=1 Tax=uncultured Reyranella sp. TaxID=735512 RepID=UPI0025EF04B6|nr:beta-propeller fold lactonase family protein [uncultured Reyranella sp.]
MRNTVITGVCVALSLGALQAQAQIAVSSNDHKIIQENGVNKNVTNPPPDTITIMDLRALPVKVVGTVSNVPGSVVGPPLSVAITPDESLALIASSSKLDPADPTKLVPDDRVTIIDLKDRRILGTLNTGAGAAGISITRDGKRAYVANRMAGSISILSIDGKDVRLQKTVPLTDAKALLSHVAVSPDGATGVVTRNGDAKVELVKLGGDTVSSSSVLDVAPRPYAVSVTPDSKSAVVASLGDPKANGILTVIDLASGKIVGTADIGHENLEGMIMSGDGRWIAGVAHAGSTRPKNAPQYKPNGMVVLYRLDGTGLTKTGEAPIGGWSQGASFSRDGSVIVVQNMNEKNLQVFKNDNGKITDTGQKIDVGGGAAAVRSSSDR